ncbi:Uncharacterised protein [Mycobacteroides abscessus subsp. abscessus]|nr:Uncharacterised protein [Mycobacteroides abscessus subsp. abscessus]
MFALAAGLSGWSIIPARVCASHMDTHPNFSPTHCGDPGLITPRNSRATLSSLGNSRPTGALTFPTITRGHGGRGCVAHTALTSTRARGVTDALVVPAALDPVGVVG